MLWAPYSSTYSLWIIVLMSLIQYVFIASVFFSQNERKNILVIYDCMNNWKIHLSFDIGRTIGKYSCIWYRHQWLHIFNEPVFLLSEFSLIRAIVTFSANILTNHMKLLITFLFKPIIIFSLKYILRFSTFQKKCLWFKL